jgi:hypothetical protein
VAVRAFRDEPSLAAGRVSGHHQILVIHAPRARSRLSAALISARWVSAWGKFRCCYGFSDSIRPYWGAYEEVERGRPDPSRCRIADRRTGDPRQNFREAVSDRGSGVRSRVETPARASEERGIAIMKLTTMTQITVDGVMQGNGPTDVDHGNGFERRTGTPRLYY